MGDKHCGAVGCLETEDVVQVEHPVIGAVFVCPDHRDGEPLADDTEDQPVGAFAPGSAYQHDDDPEQARIVGWSS